MAERNQINRITFCCLGLVFCLFAIISLVSFDINDWPNPDVAPVSYGVSNNLCGSLGAYLAYNCEYYLGPASVPILVAFAVGLVLYCMGKEVEQLVLRLIGVALVGAAVAGGSYLLNHGDGNSLSHGNGGVLGIAVGHFLLTNTAITGASLIIIATMLVGLLLAADNVLFMLPRLVMLMADQIRLSGPVLAGVGAKTSRLTEGLKKGSLGGLARAMTTATIERVRVKDEEQVEQDEYEEEEEVIEDEEMEEEQEESGDDEVTTLSASSGHTVSALAQILGHKVKVQTESGGVQYEDYSNYIYPSLDLLEEPMRGYSTLQEKAIKKRSKVLEQTLREFNLDTKVVATETGPVITMFELELSAGIKVSQITNLANDMARSLGAQAVRVVAPLAGRHTIGIEVPNSQKETVRIKELVELAGNKPRKMQIPLFLGKDATGEALVVDLVTMPHCLIAGTTGSGKSVCINSIITSILLTQRPDMVKLILIDPKMVEMSVFHDLAHLMCPIVTEMSRAEQILEWLTKKMDERYSLLAKAKVKNVAFYNKLSEEQIYTRFLPANEEEKARIPLRLPYIVMIIDELADLMMTSAKEVEGYIVRLAQKSRAVGIHLILATQRPQATVVTGLIKSNMPSRISFRVASRMDSRIVLDSNGAEALLGQGDMLFLKPGTSDLMRAQGTYIGDDELGRIIKHLKEVSQPSYHPELVQMNQINTDNMERDELFDDAVRLILESKRGSVSLLQRRLTVGYSRASRLIDQMAMAGIVGEYKGSQAREVLMTLKDYEKIRQQMERDAASGSDDMEEEGQSEATEVAGEEESVDDVDGEKVDEVEE